MKVLHWNGQPISEPGLYADVPIERYHGDLCIGPSISASGLKTIFARGPKAYFKDSYLNPHRKARKASRALLFGSACHHYLLGEADFWKRYVVRPEKLNGKDWNSNRTDCIEWLKLCKAGGLEVITLPERDAILGMVESLRDHPMIMRGILDGLVEHTMVWRDPETGVWLKSRPDVIPTSDADVSDLKTQADISDDGIERAIGTFAYHQQGALVGDGLKATLGVEMSSFTLVFAEKAEPYEARVKSLTGADLELGAQQNRIALRHFAHCLKIGRWWGYGGEASDAEYAEIQPWHRKKLEHRIAMLSAQLETAPTPIAAE